MKVLIGMADKTAWGGSVSSEPPVVAALRQMGVEMVEETYVYGDKLVKTKLLERIRRVLQTAFKFRRLLKHEKFDLVHLNTAFDTKAVLRDFATVFFIHSRRRKIFLKLHGSDEKLLETRSLILSYLWRKLLQKVDGIGVLSSEERANFIRAGVDENKVFVVKNPVEAVNSNSEKKITKTPLQLLFAARFVPSKGLLTTIRACKILLEKDCDFILNCVGDGVVRAQAEKLTAELGLESVIKFHGFVAESEIRKFYDKSDLLVLPTETEGFSMIIFNALAHGLPVITTQIRAAADYLSEPENVLWTQPKNPENLAGKIIELLENKNLRREMGENNKKLAAKFTAENLAPEYLEIYQKILTADKRR